MARILCISDCCCDLVFQQLPRIPQPGQEVYCGQLRLAAGGGANTPCGLARLGCQTAYATAVGDDDLGRVVCGGLEEAGVLPDFIQRPAGARTWVSAVLSTKEDRAFVSYAGAPVTCTREELCAMVRAVRWVHTYTYYCQQFPFLPQVCAELGVPLSLDATYTPGQKLDQLAEMLGKAALFTPNDQEAMDLTGCGDPMSALLRLAQVCPNVVLTCGSRGCLAFLDGELWQAQPPRVEVVDANGAGDLFNAGLLAARLEGKGPEDQLRMAVASGALAVTYPGGVGPMYTRAGVEALAGVVQVKRIGERPPA